MRRYKEILLRADHDSVLLCLRRVLSNGMRTKARLGERVRERKEKISFLLIASFQLDHSSVPFLLAHYLINLQLRNQQFLLFLHSLPATKSILLTALPFSLPLTHHPSGLQVCINDV